MRKTPPSNSAKKFSALDLYDDQLRSIRIEPLNMERNSTRVELELIDDGTDKSKWLTFYGCANLRYNMDFDVVASNSFALTDRSSASNDAKKMERLVKFHRSHWRTIYMPPSPKDLPIRKKMTSLHAYTLFRVNFKGGTLELLARTFTLSAKSQLVRNK